MVMVMMMAMVIIMIMTVIVVLPGDNGNDCDVHLMRGEDLGAVSLSVVVVGKLDLDRRGKAGEMFRPSSSESQPIWW